MLNLYVSHEDGGRDFSHILHNLVTYALCTYMFTYSYILTFYIYLFIYLLIVFQNPYTAVRPMDTGTIKE